MAFQFDFTKEKLSRCINNPRIGEWYSTLVATLPEYGISTKLRVAGWLSQCGHESGDFRTLVENLNYRTTALVPTFGNRISAADAARFGRVDKTASNPGQPANQPEIANRVYGGDWGRRNLGNTQPGDGWKFRGRGILQITGRENYGKCSKTMYGDEKILLDNPDLLTDYDGAVRSACWYWNSRNLNADADRGDVLAMTRKVNGGTKGLDDRRRRYDLCMSVL